MKEKLQFLGLDVHAETIHILAAKWQSHDLYGEDMPQIAADLLEARDTLNLGKLAG